MKPAYSALVSSRPLGVGWSMVSCLTLQQIALFLGVSLRSTTLACQGSWQNGDGGVRVTRAMVILCRVTSTLGVHAVQVR